MFSFQNLMTHLVLLNEFMNELEITFCSDNQEIRQNFDCDFVFRLLYKEQILGYFLVIDPQTKPKFVAFVNNNHFIYSGYDIQDAIQKTLEYYRMINKMENETQEQFNKMINSN